MKYSSSWRKPYRPLTASSTATKTAAITHTGAGRWPEPGARADVTAACARRAASVGRAAGVLPGRARCPACVTMLMFMDQEPPFKPTGQIPPPERGRLHLAGQGDLAKLGHLARAGGGRDPYSGPGQRE